jgi:RNA recognition motif-containing protein
MPTQTEPKLRREELTKKRKISECLEDLTDSPKPTSEPSPKSEAAQISSSQGTLEIPPKKRKAVVPEIEVDITAPEPPSKKTLRRLRKGKPLPPPKSDSNSSPEPSSPVLVEKPEAERRSEYGIWIGNLPWSCTKEDLRTFLVSKSDITDEAITRVHMPGPDDKKLAEKVDNAKPWKKQQNKGFAYVDFSTPENVAKAIELSEQLLSGRRVLIKDSKSFEGRPQKTKEENRNHGKPPNKRVFLGNLRFDTTEESLKEHFGCCGAIENVMLATFEDSGKCKGYAWITFEELEAAQAAVKGYVLVPDEKEDTPESNSENPHLDNGKSIPEIKKTPHTKKWFVDKIAKRPVRREFAEDAQVRYKKRFGKDAAKAATNTPDADEVSEKPPPIKKIEYDRPYAVKLTGGIVASQGKKSIF